MDNARIMLIAGEASGDMHGAALYHELRQTINNLECIAMGGVAMQEAGVRIVVDSSHLGVIGVWEVLNHYLSIRQALSEVRRQLKLFSPQVLICIDYKEFNLQAAKYAKQLGVKVVFYVSPQVWAWRPGRVRKYAELADMMAVIFPFEVEFYRNYSIPVQYVGHPLVGRVNAHNQQNQNSDQSGQRNSGPMIGLLPGSRLNEIRRLLPVMLDAAEMLAVRYPEAQFILPVSGNLDERLTTQYLDNHSVAITVLREGHYEQLKCCDVTVVASGTATLELALLGVPMIIVYKLAWLSYLLAKKLVRIPHIGLPNIIAGKEIMPELIQDEANPERIFSIVSDFLENPGTLKIMKNHLSEVAERLGDEDSVKNLAVITRRLVCQ